MSANIYFEPVNPNPKDIPTWTPSAFMEAMRAAGMELPCQLGCDALPVLTGMAATWTSKDSPNPYQAVADAIEKYGTIRLWAEH